MTEVAERLLTLLRERVQHEAELIARAALAAGLVGRGLDRRSRLRLKLLWLLNGLLRLLLLLWWLLLHWLNRLLLLHWLLLLLLRLLRLCLSLRWSLLHLLRWSLLHLLRWLLLLLLEPSSSEDRE